MELTHRFTVPADVEKTWVAFLDLEMVAGCFPGATLTSSDGDDFKGTCKVKLGPISLVYAGTGKFVERDEQAHRFVIEALGKDKRGNGTAGATVTAALSTAEGKDSTDVEVVTDLSITGKPAQFGRGVIQDVSDKLLRQFVGCLESRLGEPEPAAGAPEQAAVTAPAAPAPEASPESTDAPVPRAEPPAWSAGAATTESDDALDLGATVLPVLLKSYGKQIAVVLLALFVLRKLLARRRS